MSLNDIRDALGEVYGESLNKIPFEIIGFDACLMASYECANNINGFARYMVASEDSENGFGWYYTDFISELAKNPASNGAVLGEKICSGSLQDNMRHNDSSHSTFSVVDVSKLHILSKAHEEYFTAALNCAGSSPRFITDFANIVKGEGAITEGYDDSFVDLKSLAVNTQYLLPEVSGNLLRAIDAVIVSRANGSERIGGGISTYYPYGGYLSPSYREQNSASVSQKEFYGNLVGTPYSANRTSRQNETSNKSGSRFNVAALRNHPVTIENNQIVTRLTAKEMESVSRVSCAIVMNIEEDSENEASIIFGSNLAVKADRESGTFYSDLKGYWPALDGHLISIERTFAGKDYDLFGVPILLNGEYRILQVSYDKSTGKYRIERARRAIDKNGMSSREVDYLKAGDEITPLFLALSQKVDDNETPSKVFYDDKGNVVLVMKSFRGPTFKIGDNPTIAETMLDDIDYDVEDWNYAFIFYSPDEHGAYSDVAYFSVSDGKIRNIFVPAE